MRNEEGNHVAFLFSGNEVKCDEDLTKLKNNEIFKEFFFQAREVYHNRVGSDFISCGEEVYDQVLTYTIACSICDIYKAADISCDMVAGYSLGIYASMYGAQVYSFDTGLHILLDAFMCVKDFYDTKNRVFGMGAIIGLSEQEITENLFPSVLGDIEIACYNGERSFVVVGDSEAVKLCLEKADHFGAFKTVRLNTHYGYHTSFIKGAADDLTDKMTCYQFNEPTCVILSPLNGNKITKDRVSDEIATNLYSHVRWASFITHLVEKHQVSKAYEIGPGNSLCRMARYINKKLKMFSFAQISVE